MPLHFDTALAFDLRRELLEYAAEDFLTPQGLSIGNKFVPKTEFQQGLEALARLDKPLEGNPINTLEKFSEFFKHVQALDSIFYWKTEGKENVAYIKNFVSAEQVKKWFDELPLAREKDYGQEWVTNYLVQKNWTSPNLSYIKALFPKEAKKFNPSIGTGFENIKDSGFLNRLKEVRDDVSKRGAYNSNAIPACSTKYYLGRIIQSAAAVKTHFLNTPKPELNYFLGGHSYLTYWGFNGEEAQKLHEICLYMADQNWDEYYKYNETIRRVLVDPTVVEFTTPILNEVAGIRDEFIGKLKTLTSPKLTMDYRSTAALLASPVGSVSNLNHGVLVGRYYLNIKDPGKPLLFQLEVTGLTYKLVVLDPHSLKVVSKTSKNMSDPEPLLLDLIVLVKENK